MLVGLKILQSSTTLPTIDSLNACHKFPCSYFFVVMGENNEVFENEVFSILRDFFPDFTPGRDSSRKYTRTGRFISITVSIPCEDAMGVLKIYSRLYEIKDLRGLL